ncbi:MAG: DUF3798 domain-containing protein [Deltaproteobacteria bacterium]|jgi:hypothetical protein|nr:DUF3798 domain-containing protein [Deltaproteobacteria bacterium]
MSENQPKDNGEISPHPEGSANSGLRLGPIARLGLIVAAMVVTFCVAYFLSSLVEKKEGSTTNEPPLDSSSTASKSQGADLEVVQAGQAAITEFHIGIVANDETIDPVLAELATLYGEAESGGVLVFSDFKGLSSLVEDNKLRVLIVFNGPIGTLDAIKGFKEKRPEVPVLVGATEEDLDAMAQVANLVIDQDFISMGYLVPWGAKELGANTLVYVGTTLNLDDSPPARLYATMLVACEDLGITLEQVEVPPGKTEADSYIRQNYPLWVEKYGKETLFFTQDSFMTPVLVQGAIAHGGFFMDLDSSPLPLGYPNTFGDNDVNAFVEWEDNLKLMEQVIDAQGASGRLGTNAAPWNRVYLLALTKFARLIAIGEARVTDAGTLLKQFNSTSDSSHWNDYPYVDATLMEVPNVLLFYQDIYVLGRGYLGLTNTEVSAKYRTVMYKDGVLAIPKPYHIALVTGDFSQGSEDQKGAEDAIRRYGEASSGGFIRHFVYPDSYLDDPQALSDLVASALNDPLLKVVVVNQAIDGTADGFKRIKAIKPDTLCLSGEPFESPELVASTADLAVASDFISRGYLIPLISKELGAENLVYVSFERHLEVETLHLQRLIMEEACQDLGINFIVERAPDPAEVDVSVARAYIMETFPHWLELYGENSAFFATNDAHTGPLIKQVASLGGYFVEADIPSTIQGFPEAFDLDLEPYIGEWNEILEIVEKAVDDAGGSGRLATYVYPLGFIQTVGLVDFGKMVADGDADILDLNKLLNCLGIYSPGARWSGGFLNDPLSGKPLRNYFLIYQDTYVLGKGYMDTTNLKIPDKYYEIFLPK